MQATRREFMYVAGAAGTGVALFLILSKVYDSDSDGSGGDDGAWDLESGDQVAVESDNVLDFVGDKVSGRFEAVVYVTDEVPPGVTFTYFFASGNHANAVTSADTSLQSLALRNNFKLGKGRITKVGRSEFADQMSFIPGNLAP